MAASNSPVNAVGGAELNLGVRENRLVQNMVRPGTVQLANILLALPTWITRLGVQDAGTYLDQL